MRKASTIFTWIGVVLQTVLYLVRGWLGFIPTTSTVYTGYYYRTETTWSTPMWAWILIIFLIVISIVVAICREISLRRGNKVLVGVLTIIFASKVGGVLTLCIPEHQLY